MTLSFSHQFIGQFLLYTYAEHGSARPLLCLGILIVFFRVIFGASCCVIFLSKNCSFFACSLFQTLAFTLCSYLQFVRTSFLSYTSVLKDLVDDSIQVYLCPSSTSCPQLNPLSLVILLVFPVFVSGTILKSKVRSLYSTLPYYISYL